MTPRFKNIAFFFFMGFGVFYLTSDFLINQGQYESETLRLIYTTFDMPFFFCAGIYAISAIYLQIKKRYEISLSAPVFWFLAIVWTGFLIYLNLGYESFL